MILDVGSGTLTLHQPLSSRKEGVLHLDIKRGIKPVDIIADTHHLPFRDDAFTLVYASHVLEHTDHPLHVLREWRRVSSRALIRVPFLNKYSALNCQSSEYDHLYTWNYWSFRNLLKRVYSEFTMSIRPNSLGRLPFLKKSLTTLMRVVFQRKSDEIVVKCQR
jgi:ubiquinone/menaquinone biosynthesis C-methylase UbiE